MIKVGDLYNIVGFKLVALSFGSRNEWVWLIHDLNRGFEAHRESKTHNGKIIDEVPHWIIMIRVCE